MIIGVVVGTPNLLEQVVFLPSLNTGSTNTATVSTNSNHNTELKAVTSHLQLLATVLALRQLGTTTMLDTVAIVSIPVQR